MTSIEVRNPRVASVREFSPEERSSIIRDARNQVRQEETTILRLLMRRSRRR